jgi:ketosteroid isomerase-like protein
MSEESVEIAKQAFARFNRQDDDAMLDLYAVDAVYHSRPDEPDTGIYEGREAIRENFRAWRAMFEDLTAESDEYLDAGNSVVIVGRLSGRGRSGVQVREPYSWVISIRDGEIVEVREYRTEEEARKAAGLSA